MTIDVTQLNFFHYHFNKCVIFQVFVNFMKFLIVLISSFIPQEVGKSPNYCLSQICWDLFCAEHTILSGEWFKYSRGGCGLCNFWMGCSICFWCSSIMFTYFVLSNLFIAENGYWCTFSVLFYLSLNFKISICVCVVHVYVHKQAHKVVSFSRSYGNTYSDVYLAILIELKEDIGSKSMLGLGRWLKYLPCKCES